MPQDRIDEIRLLVHHLLRERGSTTTNPGDDESLFASGYLDSMAAMDIITVLETEFAVDFSRLDFDISLIDSIKAITALVRQST